MNGQRVSIRMRPSLRMCSRWPLARISRFLRTLMAKRGLAPLFNCTWRRWRSINCITETWDLVGGSWKRRSVVTEGLQNKAPTRSTWPNSPTARVQTIWKSFSLLDERRSGSLSDLLAGKTRGRLQVKDVNQTSSSREILPRRRSLALAFRALLDFLPAAKDEPANYVFEGSERRKKKNWILDKPASS